MLRLVGTGEGRFDALGLAVCRVELEAGAVDGDVERFDLRGDALEDRGDRVAGDRDCAVCGSMLIFERTVTLPRLNGPAMAGVMTSIPNGAPS